MTREQHQLLFVRSALAQDQTWSMILDSFFDQSELHWILWNEYLSPTFSDHTIKSFALLVGLPAWKIKHIIEVHKTNIEHGLEDMLKETT